MFKLDGLKTRDWSICSTRNLLTLSQQSERCRFLFVFLFFSCSQKHGDDANKCKKQQPPVVWFKSILFPSICFFFKSIFFLRESLAGNFWGVVFEVPLTLSYFMDHRDVTRLLICNQINQSQRYTVYRYTNLPKGLGFLKPWLLGSEKTMGSSQNPNLVWPYFCLDLWVVVVWKIHKSEAR